MIDRDRLPDAEAAGSIATPGGPTASGSRTAARLCAPPAATMVEAIIIVLSPARADLYALM
jgi:hypothetical protein